MHKRKTILTLTNKNYDNCPITQLCLQSWNRILPGHYVVKKCVNNNDQTNNYFNTSKTDRFEGFAIQKILEKGGIYMRPDTILTNKFAQIEPLSDYYEIILYGKSLNNHHNGFLMCNPIHRKKNCNKFSEIINNHKYTVIDDEKSGYLMEKKIFGVTGKLTYQNCYFSNAISVDEFLENTNGITALNINFTPEKYKNMSTDEFLNQNILLAKIFKKLLSL